MPTIQAFQSSFSPTLTQNCALTKSGISERRSRPVFVNKRVSVRVSPRPCVSRRKINPTCVVQGWDNLTAAQFDQLEASSALSICFVGMSNCGKSYWSRQLKTHRDFFVVSVDEEIERAIEPELTALGFSGIDGMAEWMGFPSDERFSKNQDIYLKYEESITGKTSPRKYKNSVLDTTGSVIYLSEETLARIRKQYLVVNLEASDDMLNFMTKNYFATPKPVVWGNAYQPEQGEEPMDAMRRCYPNLLRERRKKYAAISHVTVPAELYLGSEMKLDEFLSYVKGKL